MTDLSGRGIAPVTPLADPHPDDEAIEAFVMERGDAATRAAIQLHLQSCGACHRRYVETDAFVRAVKDVFGDRRSARV